MKDIFTYLTTPVVNQQSSQWREDGLSHRREQSLSTKLATIFLNQGECYWVHDGY